jgi:hypothetical protein
MMVTRDHRNGGSVTIVMAEDEFNETVDWIYGLSPGDGFTHQLLSERNRLFPPCEDCAGLGEVVINPNWPKGDKPYSEKCSTCGGNGLS